MSLPVLLKVKRQGLGGAPPVSQEGLGFGVAVGAGRGSVCETPLNPLAFRASGLSGVFQFLPSTWAMTPYHAYNPFTAWADVNAAHRLFVRDGHNWHEWQCGAV